MGIKKNFHRSGNWNKIKYRIRKNGKNLGLLFTGKNCKMDYKGMILLMNSISQWGIKNQNASPTLWDEWNPCQIYIKYLE